MIFSRKVMPSIRGISKSRRMTSGGNFFILSMAMIGSAATVTRNPRFSESTATRTWRTMAESSTTRTFKGPEPPAAGVVRVSVKSWCLSELKSFPVHECPRRLGDAASNHLFRRDGVVATLENTECPGASHGRFWRPEDFRCHKLQFVRHAMQALRMSEKQISIRAQVFSQAIDDFYLRLPFKIDEHVSAENQVKRASNRIRFLCEIEPLKSDHVPKFLYRFDFTLLRSEAFQQELALEFNRNAGDFLDRPDSRRRAGQDLRREVRPKNLELPSSRIRKMRQYRHGQRISVFTSGTSRAPDPNRLASFVGIATLHPFREHAASQALKRGGVAEGIYI